VRVEVVRRKEAGLELVTYSKYLTIKKTNAHAIVMSKKRLVAFLLPVCALRTARAAVRLEKRSTIVFVAPIECRSSWCDAWLNISGGTSCGRMPVSHGTGR